MGFDWVMPLPWAPMVFITNIITPKKLIATPPAFFNEIGSFKAMAAMNMVKIGVVEVMMDVSNGVVNLLDSKYANWVNRKPSIEATKIPQRSLKGTFSLGKNNEISQNRMHAPTDLKQNKPKELTRCALVSSLQMMMLNPKMV